MKKIMFFLFSFLLFTSCVSMYRPADYKKYENSSSGNFYIMYDEMQNVSIIKHDLFFNLFHNEITAYIIKNSTNRAFRCRFSYDGDDWIFFDSIILVGDNGTRLTLTLQGDEIKRNVYSGSVTENSDTRFTQTQIDDLEKIMTANIVKMRLQGKYSKDYVISQASKSALLETIKLYNTL